ncbi:hypothetical protein NIES4072_21900 [Nostoc commune NIES-4072]|uniref:Uncharacterized protein n=1 Tax=Nostoc commune NIES-4072 TaxID=2005467 RepID=A0A2R5FJQ2_NOSCO|nr:hypothetical protein NIES4070_04900 [Nostoc commune HK-02]GBG18525.1 hypothetical protein NIES4072_21900 [Nostoc commune NIES-4072]
MENNSLGFGVPDGKSALIATIMALLDSTNLLRNHDLRSTIISLSWS